jgi:hypothetical protein
MKAIYRIRQTFEDKEAGRTRIYVSGGEKLSSKLQKIDAVRDVKWVTKPSGSECILFMDSQVLGVVMELLEKMGVRMDDTPWTKRWEVYHKFPTTTSHYEDGTSSLTVHAWVSDRLAKKYADVANFPHIVKNGGRLTGLPVVLA